MTSLTELFTDYLFEKSSEITDIQITRAKECITDYFGNAVAGMKNNAGRWQTFLDHAPSGRAVIPGSSFKTDGKTACIVNGFNAHSLELDDGQRFAMIHLGASVITALLSVSSENKVRPEDFIKGLIMGYEAACRLAVTVQPSHKQKGFHCAGTCGTVGAAVAAGFALGMDKDQMKRIITAAVAGSAGMLEIQEQSSEMKPYNLGRAALDGLSACYMGFSDFCTPDDIIGGERGFIALFSEKNDISRLCSGNDYFEIDRIYVKPYAACRHCHSAIEAALDLRQEVSYEMIERVNVFTYKLAVKGHDHRKICGAASAKLSIPYSVAAAFVFGKVDLSVFEPECLNDEDALSLAEKVVIAERSEFSEQSPQKRIAEVEVLIKDGTSLLRRVDYAKGDPENPMSASEITAKTSSLIDDSELSEKIIRYIDGLENEKSVDWSFL